jgi:predicted nucleic acid-binding OB-fold protein
MANISIDENGNSMMLSELLHEADVQRFESHEDVREKLGPVCEAESTARQTGIVGKLKETFLG